MQLNFPKQVSVLFGDLLHLIYPEKCLICENELAAVEENICGICSMDLSFTSIEKSEASPMDKLFWGRCNVELSYSLLHFEKNKGSQKILFNLKYKNNPNIGRFFGKMIGEKLSKHDSWQSIDALIPVPLHSTKQFKRGYNQSEKIATGIHEGLFVPVNTKLIKRNVNSKSQTTKTKFERWKNVEQAFIVDSKIKNYKHVAIIDDVITTGSTLESIIRQINQISPQIKVSVITLAIA